MPQQQWGDEGRRGAKRESTSSTERESRPGVVDVAERGAKPKRGAKQESHSHSSEAHGGIGIVDARRVSPPSSESARVRGRSPSEPPREREPNVAEVPREREPNAAEVYASYQERLQKEAGRERELEEELRVEEAKLLVLAKERRNRQLQHSINNTKKRVLLLQQQLEEGEPISQSASSGRRRSGLSRRKQIKVEMREEVEERRRSEEDSWERGDGDPLMPVASRAGASEAREASLPTTTRGVKGEDGYWENWAIQWAQEESIKEQERKAREDKEEKERADPVWFAKQLEMMQEQCIHCRRSQSGKWKAQCWKHDWQQCKFCQRGPGECQKHDEHGRWGPDIAEVMSGRWQAKLAEEKSERVKGRVWVLKDGEWW